MKTRTAFLLPLLGSLAFTGGVAGPPAAAAPSPRPGSQVAAPRYTLRPGRLVVGWFPYSLPESTYGQYNYSLLSHLLYTGSRATDEGLLEQPASKPAALVKAVHQANKRCQVLLSISYQQPAAGPMLFDSARQDTRRQLVSAIVAQVKAAGADGVNLDFSFRPALARPAAARPATTAAAPAQAGHQAPPAQHKAPNAGSKAPPAQPAAKAAGTKQQQAAALQQQASDLAKEQESVQDDKALLATVKAASTTRQFALAPGDPAGTPAQRKAALRTGWAGYKQQVAAYHRTLEAALRAHDQVRADSLELLKGPQKLTLKNLLPKLNGDINKAFAQYQADILSRRQTYYAQLAAVRAQAPALGQVCESLRKDSLLLVFDTQGKKAFGKFAAGVERSKKALEKKEIAYKARQQAFQRAFPTPPATLPSFVQLLVSALREGNPAATVALTVPAHDSARAYASLREVAALVQLVVLKPHGGSPAAAPTAWQGPLTEARQYYQRSGIRTDSLMVPSLPAIAAADSTERLARYKWVGQHFGGVALPAADYGVAAGSVARALVGAALVQAPPTPAPLPWLRLSPLQQVLLSGVGVLLGAVLLGFGVAAAFQLRQIVPFPWRLGRAILLTGGLFALVSTCFVALRYPYHYASVLYWLAGLGILLVVVVIGYPRRPTQLP